MRKVGQDVIEKAKRLVDHWKSEIGIDTDGMDREEVDLIQAIHAYREAGEEALLKHIFFDDPDDLEGEQTDPWEAVVREFLVHLTDKHSQCMYPAQCRNYKDELDHLHELARKHGLEVE